MSVKYDITCYMGGRACNLRCSYCYVTEGWNEEHSRKAEYKYSVSHMIKAFSPERLGGLCSFTVIGGGETLILDETIEMVHGLLRYGHLVNVVTNATLTERLKLLLDVSQEDIGRLSVKGSLHYAELKRLNMIDTYFTNLKMCLDAGASAHPFMVTSREYVPYFQEIADTSMKYLGARPHCSPRHVYDGPEDLEKFGKTIADPECDEEFCKTIDEIFDSEVFRVCVKNMPMIPQEHFCYAGKYNFFVNMETGDLWKCQINRRRQNFLDDITKPYEPEPVACFCTYSTCSLQYNLLAYGLCPDYTGIPTNTQMMISGGREHLFTKEFKEMLDFKFIDGQDEREYTQEEKYRLINKIYYDRERHLLDIIDLKNKEIACMKKEMDARK